MCRHVPCRALGSYAPGKYIRYENFGSHSDPHGSVFAEIFNGTTYGIAVDYIHVG